MELVNSLLSMASQMQGGINILDILIIAIVAFYAHEGYTLGFTIAAFDLASFILSFIIALKFYGVVAQFLNVTFAMPIGFANAIGFFLLAFISEIILSILFRKVLIHIPTIRPSHIVYKLFKKIDRYLGLIPGVISAFIVLAFLLTVIVSLPSSPMIKRMVTGSVIGSKMISNTSFFEKKLNDIFGGALHETLNFLTVAPQSNEIVKLHFTLETGSVNPEAEQLMFQLVNKERQKAGLPALSFDSKLQVVARAHSQDMFQRGYFSHYTPEGLSPFDRMANGGIEFSYAGENLALAPSTELAMQGLMDSPGHRANILNPNFGKIGIGAIDGGVYGIMFSQEFTD